MKITEIKQVEDFRATVNACKGEVTLTSPYGDKYNLKSCISLYMGIGALLGDHGDELELWCDNKEDESRFMRYFRNHPQVLQ